MAFILLAILGGGVYLGYSSIKKAVHGGSLDINIGDILPVFAVVLGLLGTAVISLGAAHVLRARRPKLLLKAQLKKAQESLKDWQGAATAASHPLLAEEIGQLYTEGRDLSDWVNRNPAFESDAVWREHARDFVASCGSIRRRVRRARFAFTFGLPLARESAANFAVVNMASRIERISDLIAPGW